MAKAGLSFNTSQASFSNPTDGLTTALNAFQTQMTNADERERQILRQEKADKIADSEYQYKLDERSKNDAEKAGLLAFETKRRTEDNMLSDSYVTNAYVSKNRQNEINAMSYTPEEIALSERVKGDETQYTPAMIAKTKAQVALSSKSDEISSTKGLLETDYEEALRFSKDLPMTESLVNRLNQLEAADIAAKKAQEAKNDKLLTLKSKAEENAIKYGGKEYTENKKDFRTSNKTGEGGSSGTNVSTDSVVKYINSTLSDEWKVLKGGDSTRSEVMNAITSTNMLDQLNGTKLTKKQKLEVIKDSIALSLTGNSLNDAKPKTFMDNYTSTLASYKTANKTNSGNTSFFKNQSDAYTTQADNLETKYLKSQMTKQEIVNSILFGAKALDNNTNKVQETKEELSGKKTPFKSSNTEGYKKQSIIDKKDEIKGVPNYLTNMEGGAQLNSYQDGKKMLTGKDGKQHQNKAISTGYNYTSTEFGGKKSPKEIRTFLEGVNIPENKIQAALRNENVSFSKSEADSVAEKAFNEIGVDKAKRIISGYDKLSPVMQKMANQMAYRGDLNSSSKGYQGDLVKILKSNDMNAMFDYINTSDKLNESDRKILTNRMNDVLLTKSKGEQTKTENLGFSKQNITTMTDEQILDKFHNMKETDPEYTMYKQASGRINDALIDKEGSSPISFEATDITDKNLPELVSSIIDSVTSKENDLGPSSYDIGLQEVIQTVNDKYKNKPFSLNQANEQASAIILYKKTYAANEMGQTVPQYEEYLKFAAKDEPLINQGIGPIPVANSARIGNLIFNKGMNKKVLTEFMSNKGRSSTSQARSMINNFKNKKDVFGNVVKPKTQPFNVMYNGNMPFKNVTDLLK